MDSKQGSLLAGDSRCAADGIIGVFEVSSS